MANANLTATVRLSNAQVALMASTTLYSQGKWSGQPLVMAEDFKRWLDDQDKAESERID